MPELPDVNYFKDYFNRTAVGKKITQISCGDTSLLEDLNCAFLGRALHGKKFAGASRRGKFLIAGIDNSNYLLVLHFGMTGHISYGKTSNRTDTQDKHGHLFIHFENGYELRWICQRKLGSVHFVHEKAEVPLLDEMGPEALEISKEEFLKLLSEHNQKNIKSFLMDQRDIAGIGREYADEILYRAGIDPHHIISDISERRRERLYSTMQDRLTAAVAVRSIEDGMGDEWLKAHHDDMQCPQDSDHELRKEQIAGVASYWCPQHQK